MEGSRPTLGRSAASIALAASLVACASGPNETSTAAVLAGSTRSAAAPDASITETFDVNGRELYLECLGRGEPTMILEVGEGSETHAMGLIRDAYQAQLRVCTYDRANKGRSDAAPTPRSGADIVADLHGLLETANVAGPYLLVGQSAGGLLVQAYAAKHPEDVVGVVAMNPVPPWQWWSTMGFRRMTPRERRATTRYYTGTNREGLDYRGISAGVRRLPEPADIPFHLLMSTVAQCEGPHTMCARTYPTYEKILRYVASQWPQGRFSQVRAPHKIYMTDMADVRRAIDDVLARAEGS